MPNRKFLLAASLLLASAAPVLAATAQPARPAAAGKAQYGSFGVDLAARDLAVKPGDDFFRYANGTWLRTTQIPADRTSWSLWTVLSEDIERQVRAIVTEGATSRDPGQRKVADFYAAWMDEAGIEARGTAPLQPWLQRIAAIRNRADLIAVFATPGYTAPVGVGIIPDLANPTRYTAIAGQSGLGMPNRDYYLREGAQYDGYRTAYRAYVVQLHNLAGIPDAEARADRIIALERRIAEAHWTPERSRDIQAINNPMNRAQLAQLAPQLEWDQYLQRRGLGSVDTVIATQTTAITGIGRLLDEVPLDTWKEYLAFHFINSYAQYLPRAFDEAKFNFFSRTLRGQQQQRERWKRGLSYVNGAMGEAVGSISSATSRPRAGGR